MGRLDDAWLESLESVDRKTDFISVVPAPDLKTSSLKLLAVDLVSMGMTKHGGLHLCEVKGYPNLESLARDGRVIWSEKAHEIRLPNAVAGAIVGSNEIRNSSLGLDGSGEKITLLISESTKTTLTYSAELQVFTPNMD